MEYVVISSYDKTVVILKSNSKHEGHTQWRAELLLAHLDIWTVKSAINTHIFPRLTLNALNLAGIKSCCQNCFQGKFGLNSPLNGGE